MLNPNQIENEIKNKMDLIYLLLKTYNLRISEILMMQGNQIRGGKFIFVKGVKGSQNVIIRESRIVGMCALFVSKPYDFVFEGITYSKVYNWLEKYHSTEILSRANYHNRSVTHSYRHANANLCESEEEATLILNHKNTKSQEYYYKK